MPEMFETISDPATLAFLDQVCADYYRHTGKRPNTLILEEGEYSLCDKLHWHYVGPVDVEDDG